MQGFDYDPPEYKRLTVVLTEEEWRALCNLSRKHLRQPRAQIRYMVQVVTGLEPVQNDTALARMVEQCHQ